MSSTHKTVHILYDSDCYLCSHFQTYLKLKQSHNIIYSSIHDESDYVTSITSQGYDLDHGMIIDIDGEIYQGPHAITQIEKLISGDKRYDHLMKRCMKTTLIRSIGYPIASSIRKILLFCKSL